MMKLAWIIPLLPLLSFIIFVPFGKKIKDFCAYISIVLVGSSFILSAAVLVERFSNPTYHYELEWLRNGTSNFTIGIEVNQLNALMLCIVSFISLMVHIYSKVYMKGDERFHIFFAYLGLFTFAMLGLVLSPNLLQLYIFWELVGLGSFLLIGFYHYKESAKKAAKKAFIITRIGDVGLMLGILFIFSKTGTFNIQEIFYQIDNGAMTQFAITLAALLIFIGAMGKSGQFPMHTWLPDAMEGPTPVSALIHAATMVAAGVYLVATMFPLFAASETALLIVAIIGGFTAIFAASIALVQKDIKRVLAYSTVSQLGYMMLALGSGGYVAGVFHLTTHAFFKALLFLAAGSVIHAAHTQNIDEMGGLWKKMRFTGPLFLVATLAIVGAPFLSGFFSKDEILGVVWNADRPILFIVAMFTAVLTAFYMFRLFFKVFFGTPKESTESAEESSNWMTWPMIAIGVFTVIIGYINTPWFGTFLGKWLVKDGAYIKAVHESSPIWVMLLAVCAAALGVAIAWFKYEKSEPTLNKIFKPQGRVHQILMNKYYVDELFNVTVLPFTKTISVFLALIEFVFVKGVMKGIIKLFKSLSTGFTRVQNGQVQTYGTIVILGLAIVLIVFVIAGGYWKWIF